jgi:hypothetical protein
VHKTSKPSFRLFYFNETLQQTVSIFIESQTKDHFDS